jgi:hypothetical protein
LTPISFSSPEKSKSSSETPLPLRTARRERPVGSVGPRNGADRLLHPQCRTTVDCVLVEGKGAQMLASSLVRIITQRTSIDMARRVLSGDELSVHATRGTAWVAWPVGPPNLWEPSRTLSTRERPQIGFYLPAPPEVVARQSQREAVMLGAERSWGKRCQERLVGSTGTGRVQIDIHGEAAALWMI